jgi:hypothetical protein
MIARRGRRKGLVLRNTLFSRNHNPWRHPCHEVLGGIEPLNRAGLRNLHESEQIKTILDPRLYTIHELITGARQRHRPGRLPLQYIPDNIARVPIFWGGMQLPNVIERRSDQIAAFDKANNPK